MSGLRPGVSTLIEYISKSREHLIFLAPTGYGKTSSIPAIYKAALKSMSVARLIHVLPLRAIVEQAFKKFAVELEGSAVVGYQAHGLGAAGKSPFFASDLIVTALDSFLVNLYRGNVAERSMGHYEVPRAHIITSIVVLDEAHLPFQSGEPPFYTAVLAATYSLTYLRVPLVIESATLPAHIVGKLKNHLYNDVTIVMPVPPGSSSARKYYSDERDGCRIYPVEDKEYFEWAASITWRYASLRKGESLRKMYSLASKGLRVLRVTSTVAEAVSEYTKLVKQLDGEKVVLIHGRMTPEDRRNAIEKLDRAQVVIGTSAIEAGIDASFDALITDIPLGSDGNPRIEPLLQRMGRVKRWQSDVGEALVYLTGGREAQDIASYLNERKVNPRLPLHGDEKFKGQSGYLDLFEKYAGKIEIAPNYYSYIELAKKILLPKNVESIMNYLCSLTGRTLLIPVAPHYDDLNLKYDYYLKEINNYIFPIDSEMARSKANEWFIEDNEALVIVAERSSIREHPDAYNLVVKKIEGSKVEKALPKCSRSPKGSLTLQGKPLVAFILRKGVYKRGLGLV